MKRILFIALTLLLFYNHNGYSQEIPEGAILIDENTIIKDESGNKVEMSKLMDLMNSGEWSMDSVKDADGKVLYMQLRKASSEEKKMRAEMPMQNKKPDQIGESAPAFSMKDINGNLISTENTKGKILVLNFWFAACKPCIAEIPDLNEVYEKFKTDTNVVFASITFEKKEIVNSFLQKNTLNYPVVSDAKEICNLFKISGYPANIVIDKDGKYYEYIIGGNPEIGHHISMSIQNALDGKKPVLNAMPSDEMMIDPGSTFKLENGDVVSFEKAIDLLNSNSYDLLTKKDDDQKQYYLLKKKK